MSGLGIAAIAALAVTMSSGSVMAQAAPRMTEMKVSHAAAHAIIAKWGERPRLGAAEMMAKYGDPQEASSEMMIWHNAGPFKRITVMNLETPHDFPLPHVDFMEHTISYNVPLDKVGALIEFDGSSTINRTVGELSARCDLEGHNILTLNLDHDIVTGRKTVEEARMAFGEIVTQDVLGQHPPYVEALQFKPAMMSEAAFSDSPVIPGSPLRAAEARAQGTGSDIKANNAEVLASLIAIDLNEVLAAMQASTKKLSQPVLAYAKMLHEEHGKNMVQTMKLGQQISVTPVITQAVEQVQKKGAEELAKIVQLDGNPFERAFIAMMIKGHDEALAMIDSKLLESAGSSELKTHLTATRAAVASHQTKAKALQEGVMR